MFKIRFINTNPDPIFIQVEPWAGLYRLEQGHEVKIAADLPSNSEFEIEEHDDTRFLTLVHAKEYYVEQDGKWVHWTEFPNNDEQ